MYTYIMYVTIHSYGANDKLIRHFSLGYITLSFCICELAVLVLERAQHGTELFIFDFFLLF